MLAHDRQAVYIGGTDMTKDEMKLIQSLQKRIEKLEKPKAKHTNGIITSRFVRGHYASELWQWRKYRRIVSADEWRGFRLGLESGIWAMQKAVA